MAEAMLPDHQPRPPSAPTLQMDSNDSNEEFDSLQIPPLDPMFLSAQNPSLPSTMNTGEYFVSDLTFSFEDNYDFDIPFDDLEDFYFPPENENFSIPNSTPESGSSGVSADHVSDVDKYLNCSPSESRCCDSGSQSSNSAAPLNFSSPVSSQVSENGMSVVSEAMNAPSDSDSGTFAVDQKIKTEYVNVRNGSVPKRKKEITSDDTNSGSRIQKYRRSENSDPNSDAKSASFVAASEEDEKRKARLMRNRESAQLSRQRKKHYVEELEDKVRTMNSTIADLNSKISYFMAENATLRQHLSGNGMRPPPMYPPMAPMSYPWMPCVPYVVRPQGTQVPLVAIPRLKSQQPASVVKPKKAEAKITEGKTKKVSSVSFLGLLLFVLMFGGLVPIVNVKFGGVRENASNGLNSISDKFYDQHRGRVLIVHGHSNGSHNKMDSDRIRCARGRDGYLASDAEKKQISERLPNSDEFGRLSNSSKQLAASLYVPRNDKLVKIDGNLIIHSILANERAMASHDDPEVSKNKETSLAISRDFSPTLAIPGTHSHSGVSNKRGVNPHRYRTTNERQKALASGPSDTLKDHLKSSAANGNLQQWFHEGLAGPMWSSGMCSEVFQFDASPAPGAVVPASSVANITSQHKQNATQNSKGIKRRILHDLPIPLSGSDFDSTRKHVRSSEKDKFQGNKSVSSMVISVLVDPREGGDSEVDGMVKPKSISRIFVVVLLDSVKYVTYSCMLPHAAAPHLVTT